MHEGTGVWLQVTASIAQGASVRGKPSAKVGCGSQHSLIDFCRRRGLGGRSLNARRINLGRDATRASKGLRLMELVPAHAPSRRVPDRRGRV